MNRTLFLAALGLAWTTGHLPAQLSTGGADQTPPAASSASPTQTTRPATSSPASTATTTTPAKPAQPSHYEPLSSQVGQPNPFETWWNGDYATGDWGGYRTKLKDDGFEPFAYYNAIVAGNPVGGRSHAASYADDFYFGLKFDLNKMADIHGLSFEIDGINRDGRDITKEVGSQYQVMELVGAQTLLLYDVFVQQKLFDDKLTLKAGRMTAGDDFLTTPVYYYYLNSDIDGNIRAPVFDTGFSTYPFAIWAAQFRIDPSPEFNFISGAYQKEDDEYNSHNEGLDFRFHSTDGYMIVNQAGWTPEFDKQPVEVKAADGTVKTVDKGLPGHYFIGGYYSRFHYPEFGTTTIAHGSYGFYVHGDQVVYQESPGSEQGLTVFNFISYCPQQDISITPFQVSGGLLYRGLVPDRDEDMTILGLTRGRFSEDYANAMIAAGNGDPHTESVIELGYRFQFNAWSFFQPDIQYVFTPGGTGNIPDAVVLGTFMGFQF